MKFYKSIRFRIVAGILLFGFLLIGINSAIFLLVMANRMSKMSADLIATEMDAFLYKYGKDHTTPLPHSKYIDVYRGMEGIPEEFRGVLQGLGPGMHVVKAEDQRIRRYVGVMELADQDVLYYMIFHHQEFFKENIKFRPKRIVLLSLALLVAPGIIIGYFTSRMVFAPVVSLMEKIQGLNPENLPTQFSRKHADNEIGVLTRTIETAMSRINAFIQREKQFTRDASHELRTPLTIAKGAVEILEQQPELETNPLLKNPLKRISQSVRDMETTIETFLWLAREENGTDVNTRVEPVTQKAIEDNRYLIEGRDVEVEIKAIYDKVVNIKEEVLYIAVANLIRNAFQYTTRGAITITVDEARISIRDTGVGIETDRMDSVTEPHVKSERSHGFGLGLSIVSRLCKRFGWELKIESQVGQGTLVEILWRDA